ncbi:MAG: FAD-dependent oxidoreductase, partial [Pseudomonadota bacterium]
MSQSRYDILFEPVPIGPVTAPNRFYQVPHCNVLGYMRPRAEAANRAVKAEGGWGVICTQEVEIHPSSELTPFVEGRLWDERDIPQHRLMTDAVHAHGALAGIELAYNGHHANNLYSRIAPMAPSPTIVHGNMPVHARGMTRDDIRNVRRWHVNAAKRAKEAGYDIIYVYAGHDMVTLMHFLKKSMNHRTDEYGGSIENRARLLSETLTDVKDAIGDTCAVALRFATDEKLGEDGLQWESEGRDVVGMLAEIPDLWDVNIADWGNDSATARFEPAEGYQEKFTAFVKELTTKPVVGVGRFTSPDAMVSQIKRGSLDLIGAARPSIADPFLPNKIREGRIEDIRECIGCNICVAQDNMSGPIRCTQNPTQGEEWKRRWHPERIAPATEQTDVLIVGGGPAGLECALSMARRGHNVSLADAREALGGRTLRDSHLPAHNWISPVDCSRAKCGRRAPRAHRQVKRCA